MPIPHPHYSRLLPLLAAFSASTTLAQTAAVELRIIERTGRTLITDASDAQLNLAVQARVTGGPADFSLASAAFTIHIVGEPEANGSLARCLITRPDRTYATTFSVNSAVGSGGLAGQYTYLAGINASFNGVINTSSGTFTNTPDHEIGLILANASGAPLLATPGLDLDADGSPDTWDGVGNLLDAGACAPLDPQIAATYFARKSWIDIYRFRYTTTNFQPRTLFFRLDRSEANVSPIMVCTRGVWGFGFSYDAVCTAFDLAVSVNGTPAGACCSAHTCTLRFQSDCPASATFAGSSTCSPSPCDSIGVCCLDGGACAPMYTADCTGTFTPSGSCTPSPCVPRGACCADGGACAVVESSRCGSGGYWYRDGACSNAWCSQLVTCCRYYTTACVIIPRFNCASVFITTGACSPDPCSPPACCLYDGGCSLTYSCSTGLNYWGGTCEPNTCPPRGSCCQWSGGCTAQVQSLCYGGVWTPTVACTPYPCPPPGSCCYESGSWCQVTIQSACATQNGAWSPTSACPTTLCPQSGACCLNHACIRAFPSTCTAPGQSFAGPFTTCGTTPNPIACCPANFNRIDGTNITDLFDFLNAWFALDPRTDFDHSGTLSMADVFAYLNAWSLGC